MVVMIGTENVDVVQTRTHDGQQRLQSRWAAGSDTIGS